MTSPIAKQPKTASVLLALCAAMVIPAHAQTFSVLANFNRANGAGPQSLAQGVDGNFYGTTGAGGPIGYGTVFRLTPSGSLTSLYYFCSLTNCPDGWAPNTGLLLATDGYFYGTTQNGGSLNSAGTVFKISGSGALTTLYSFCVTSGCPDGANPLAGLAEGLDRDGYGTAYQGGAYGSGTVFKITSTGALTTLHNFCSTHSSFCPDGANPAAGMVLGADGNLWGTTQNGGKYGDGTVFKISSSGTLTTIYSFCALAGCADGAFPDTALVQGSDGNFYGGTLGGGIHTAGTLFKVTPKGKLTDIYDFCLENCLSASSALVQATDGNFYGTTFEGGPDNLGTIFRITSSGILTVLHNFAITDGGEPNTGVIQATNGTFYGTTLIDGTGTSSDCPYGCGTAVSLSEGLGPFVKTIPTAGFMGSSVMILGNNLTGATSVTFNGTEAAFTVVSATEITTIVPTGATTGTIKVVTPSETLSSNVPYRVRR